jgi:hypothetical protein
MPVSRALDSFLNTEQCSSRAAFEKLLESTNDEWSQMSRMKRMLDNDAETEVADAIVRQLAKVPGPADDSKLPNMQLDSNSLSGLSVLQSEPSRQNYQASSGIGLMASVLERTSKSDSDTNDSLKPAAMGAKQYSKSSKTQEHPNLMLSPRRRPPAKGAIPSTPGPPSTPGRSTIFSMTGTPIGLVQDFRSSPSGGLKGPRGFSLTPNRSIFSPGPGAVDGLYNGTDFNTSDGFKFGELSAQGLDGNHDQTDNANDPNPPPLTPSNNSLLFESGFSRTAATPMDMEAISALHSLSNSPAKGLINRQDGSQRATQKKKSFFESVVGGMKDKDPKKRLQF